MKRQNSFTYCIHKAFTFLLSILILSAAVFFVARLAPGDPLVSYYGERAEKMTVEEREQAQERLGLNEPLYIQYVRWLENAFKGDLGVSFKYKTDVLEIIAQRLPNTLILGGIGFALIFLLAPALGMLCALHENDLIDRIICRVGTMISCIPEFWLSLILILIFSLSLGWLPASGSGVISGQSDISERAAHLILPLTAAVLTHLWYYAYMIRSRLIEEIRAEYVLLAKSRGLSRKSIVMKHCLRNIIPSYLSIMAVSVPHIMGGTYIIETVFSYPGLGTLSYESARYQDYNLLMALCLFSGVVVILCNMIAQIINERIDPRIRDIRTVYDPEVTGVG